MKRSSCLIFIVMVSFGMSQAAFYEEPGKPINLAPHEEQPLHKIVQDPRVGVESLGNAAYELALQRAQLRADQARGVIAKAHAKIRSMVGLPPQPKPLVAGEFLEKLTAAEKEALASLNKGHAFSSRPVAIDNQVIPTTEVISARIKALKTRIDTVLANKNNYSDTKHIDVLINEVDGLSKALQKTIDQESDSFKKTNPDETDDENNENNAYVTTIEQGLSALKDLQQIQTDFPSLKSTWFSKLFRVSSKPIGPVRVAKLNPLGDYTGGQPDPHFLLPNYLFLDIPGQPQLQSMVREKAFELCKNLFLKDYAPKNAATKAKVQQFFTDYTRYKQGGVEKSSIESEIKDIITPPLTVQDSAHTAQQVSELEKGITYPKSVEVSTVKPAPVVPDPSTVKLYQEQQAAEALKQQKLVQVQAQHIIAEALAKAQQEKDAQALAELKQRVAEQKAHNELPPAPRVLTGEETALIAAKNAQLSDIEDGIDEYQNDFDDQLAKIDELLSSNNSLKEADINDLLQEYKALKNGVKQYDELSNELDELLSVPEQSVGDLGVRRGQLYESLKITKNNYEEKMKELEDFGIKEISDAMKTFTKAESFLEAGAVDAVQKLSSPQLINKLCEYVFWKSSSPLLQKWVRRTAMEYLGRGFPAEVEQMKHQFSLLDLYQKEVSESVASHDLVDKLKVFKDDVKDSKVPQQFKDLVSGKIQKEIDSLDRRLFPVNAEIAGIREQLLDVIAGRKTFGEFVTRNSDKTDLSSVVKILDTYPYNDEVIKQLTPMLSFMEGKNQYVQETLTDSKSPADSKKPTGQRALNAILTLTKDNKTPKDFGSVAALLFFKEKGSEWAQYPIQKRAVALLQEALSKSLLTNEEKSVFQKVLDDYQIFKKNHDELQKFTGVDLITSAEQAKLMELKIRIQDEQSRIKEEYLNAPDYVQNFKVRFLDSLRADEAQIVSLEGEVAAEKIKVVADADGVSDTSFKTPNGSKPSGAETFYTAYEGAAERDKDFEEALPEAVQLQVTRAMGSIAQLKTLGAQFSVHAQAVDSIGLAEEGLAIVTAFEASMPQNILSHDEGMLKRQVDALKLLFNDAMNNQKLAVVASLQALRASVVHEFGATVFPPATAKFKQQVASLLTPQFEDSLSEGSAFKKFVVEIQGSLDSTPPETKTFFTLLNQEQVTLKDNETNYAKEIEDLQDQDVVDALASHPKQGALAAVEVVIPKLEDAYRVAVFETLTDKQKMAFESHNPSLYEKLILKKQAQILKTEFEDYLLKAYEVVFDAIKTPEQAEVLLNGGEVGPSGVDKELGKYETFMGRLRVSKDVNVAFELYETLTPLYQKLKDVEKGFKLLKSYLTPVSSKSEKDAVENDYFDPNGELARQQKVLLAEIEKQNKDAYKKASVRDKMWSKVIEFLVKATKRDPSSLPSPKPFEYENAVLQDAFGPSGPVVYLEKQEMLAQKKIENFRNPVVILGEAQKLQSQVKAFSEKDDLAAQKLNTLKTRFESLEEEYKSLESVYEKHQAALDSAFELGAPGDAPLAFEINLKPKDWEKLSEKKRQEVLEQERQQTADFIARALSVPGSVIVPPSILFDPKSLARHFGILDADKKESSVLFSACRKELEARLIATEKTNGPEMVQSYRDLGIPLRNDLLWAVLLEKLQGKAILIPENVKEKMVEDALKAKITFPSGLKDHIDSIKEVLVEVQTALASKGAVKVKQ